MWICVVLIWLITTNIYAANPYQMGEVDYFNHEDKAVKDQKIDQEVFDFRDPTIGADGNLTYYTPPSAVLTLLEAPTLENARAYLMWQRRKVQKIIKAQEIIDQVIKEDKQL